MAAVIDRSDEATTERAEPYRQRNWAIASVFVLLAALVGFGAGWLVFRDAGTDVPSEVQELLDDYTAAWNEADGSAAAEMLAVGGAVFGPSIPDEGLSGEAFAAFVDGLPGGADFISNLEYLGVFGDAPYVVVASATVRGSVDADIHEVFHVIDELGTLKIANHTAFPG